jgi:hypothetical protein
MTEQDWLACTDPQKMLGFLASTQNSRKLRLFAVECCCLLLPFINDPHSRKALQKAEQHAEGQVSSEKTRRRRHDPTPQDDALWAVTLVVEQDFSRLKWLGGWVNRVLSRVKESGMSTPPALDELQMLRCIFGNPFGSPAIHSTWLAWNGGTVPKIAKGIYNERAFDRLPILADALEESGCDSENILSHCRESGFHARGCWALDLLLGKK